MTDDDVPHPIYEYYLRAYGACLDNGYVNEIDWCRRRKLEDVTPQEFLFQYQFAVFSSSGLNHAVVEKSMKAFHDAYREGRNPFEEIRNRRMHEAILSMYSSGHYNEVFKEFRSKRTDEEKIEFLQTLPQIGKKEKYHLARNLGIDCVKPDRHMDRLAESFGFKTPLEMCRKIQEYENERLGVIDVILWRYCNLTREYS